MPAEAWKARAAQALERLRPFAGWCRHRLGPRVVGFLEEAWQEITGHRVRSLAVLLVAAAVLAAGIRLVPAAYGRQALVHAARTAARQSRMKGEDRVLRDLRHRAFELGLTEGALEPDVFQIVPGLGEEGPLCTVTYDFVHTVDFYGTYRMPLRIRGQVTAVSLDPLPNPVGVD